MVTRRTLLASASVTATLAALGITPEALAADRVKLGDAAPFSFDALIERARTMAGKPYTPPATAPADILSKIDYEAHGKIKFDTAHALFADGPGQFPVTFFHLGTFFRAPVRMHVVEKGAAREIVYDESYFDMPADSPARKLPRGSGFAGFRFQESRLGDQKKLDWKKNDWVAFWARRTSAPSASCISTGFPHGALRWTWRRPASRKSFPISRTCGSTRRQTTAPIP